MIKGTVSRDFFFRLFHESSFPKPPKITLGSFWIFWKICGDVRKWRCTTSINDNNGKFATCINDTGGKFRHRYCWCCWYQWKVCTGVNDTTTGKFSAGVNDSGGKLLLISLTPAAKNGNSIRLLTPKSKLKEKKFSICWLNYSKKRCSKKITNFLIEDFFYLPQVSTTLAVNLKLWILYLREFSKKIKTP